MPITYPYTLTNGTTADADEVQANFDEVSNNFDQDTIDDASADNTAFQTTKLPSTSSKPTNGREEIQTLRYQILKLMQLLKPAITTWDEVPAFLSAVLSSPILTTPQINDTSADHQYIVGVSELTADRTVTLPLLTGNDVFVFADFIQTLSNKTFSDAITATGGIILDGTNTELKKTLTIGSWNMDTASSVDVAHGLSDFKKIRAISATIRSDDNSNHVTLPWFTAAGQIDAWIQAPSTTNVQLTRRGTGFFDSANYDLTQYTLDNAAAVDKGDGTVGIPITAHTFLADDVTTIAGTTNYNGTFTIVSVSANEIVITTSYSAETFAGTETASWSRGWIRVTYYS